VNGHGQDGLATSNNTTTHNPNQLTHGGNFGHYGGDGVAAHSMRSESRAFCCA
jgi:hypothetical protein